MIVIEHQPGALLVGVVKGIPPAPGLFVAFGGNCADDLREQLVVTFVVQVGTTFPFTKYMSGTY